MPRERERDNRTGGFLHLWTPVFVRRASLDARPHGGIFLLASWARRSFVSVMVSPTNGTFRFCGAGTRSLSRAVPEEDVYDLFRGVSRLSIGFCLGRTLGVLTTRRRAHSLVSLSGYRDSSKGGGRRRVVVGCCSFGKRRARRSRRARRRVPRRESPSTGGARRLPGPGRPRNRAVPPRPL